jgi:two-component system CheB/CheR fusion protein
VTLKDTRVFIDRVVSHGFPTALSCFLNSAAGSKGPPTAAVILSGVGDDGSSALGAIKSAGGITLAQLAPEFSGMADSAIATDNIDSVGSPREIADALMVFDKHSQASR